MILRNFISLPAFTFYMENSVRFEIDRNCQIDRGEICTEVSFTSPEVMWTLIIKLPLTEVKFYPKVKSQTGLSSLRVSSKCAHSLANRWNHLPLASLDEMSDQKERMNGNAQNFCVSSSSSRAFYRPDLNP